MNRKKARSSVAALERETEIAASEKAAFSVPKCNTASRSRQALAVADFLGYGQEEGRAISYLQNVLNVDGRTVRQMIRKERLSGIPICEDNRSGYFLPSCERDITQCAASLRRRAAEIIKVADALEEAK